MPQPPLLHPAFLMVQVESATAAEPPERMTCQRRRAENHEIAKNRQSPGRGLRIKAPRVAAYNTHPVEPGQ